jgi:hypothetical protein
MLGGRGGVSDAFRVIEDGHAHELAAEIANGRVRIPSRALETALGYALKPEGLCRGELCFPVRDRAALAVGGAIDLQELARVTGRPLAVDPAERSAALGTALEERMASLRGLEAPDFTLPDFAGRTHSLAEFRGKKVLLIAYASW